jgi:hypothetical protein
MGYVVRKLPYKSRTWKVQYQDRSHGNDKWRDIPEDEYLRLGFHPKMTLDEAQARRNSLNALEELKRQEAKRVGIQAKFDKEELVNVAFLNALDKDEFEKKILYSNSFSSQGTKKIKTLWTVAQRVIREIKLDPSEWEDSQRQFYIYFEKNQWSYSYLKKLIPMINMWGKFITKKRKEYFSPIPLPKGYAKEQIQDSHLKKQLSNESEPLTPEVIEGAREGMKKSLGPKWRWLFVSLWFGLRPTEVDSLQDSTKMRVETHKGKKVLFVYQTKLRGIPHEKRWKAIPCLYPEQREALMYIEEGLERPLVKTIVSYCGVGLNTYAGRKGFTDLMLDKGHSLEDISSWMGHTSIDRTWRSYKNRQKIAGL